MFNSIVKIKNLKIGGKNRCALIAEAGVNHDGSLDKAYGLIDAASRAKADFVKFQNFNPDRLLIKKLEKAEYQKKGDGTKGTYHDMISRLTLSKDVTKKLASYCKKKKINFMSTPFDTESVDLLNSVGVSVFKIDSGNLNNHPHIRYIARKMKPVILSTGMSSIAEIDEAINVIKDTGNRNLILLHCTSSYPADVKLINLRAMETLRLQYNIPVGYSDHTQGIHIPTAACALGAHMIEKHFTLDRNAVGPDHKASILPSQLAQMSKDLKSTHIALGISGKIKNEIEVKLGRTLRRSLVVEKNIRKGEKLSTKNLSLKRPGDGIPSKYLKIITGRKSLKSLKRDHVLSWSDFG